MRKFIITSAATVAVIGLQLGIGWLISWATGGDLSKSCLVVFSVVSFFQNAKRFDEIHEARLKKKARDEFNAKIEELGKKQHQN